MYCMDALFATTHNLKLPLYKWSSWESYKSIHNICNREVLFHNLLQFGNLCYLCMCLQYYQALFRDGECFVHIVTLLNEDRTKEIGSQLSLDVLLTLTRLLQGNEASKVLLPPWHRLGVYYIFCNVRFLLDNLKHHLYACYMKYLEWELVISFLLPFYILWNVCGLFSCGYFMIW